MLHHLLKRVLEIDPARPILESDGAWTTAADLERLASRLASGLAAMGLEEGDRVALLLPNCLETVVCYLACFRMHLVAVPLDSQYHPLQVGYALGHSGASVLLRKVTVEHFVTALRRQPAKTFLTLTPGGLGELMASPEFWDCDFSHLRLCLAGGDRVPTRLLEAFERLKGVAITEQCGSTETGPYAMNPRSAARSRDPSACRRTASTWRS
jgi:acyl-CoA synthetase (AMP-forming)/AMP-acid ligase II